jgi:hypothetical protein
MTESGVILDENHQKEMASIVDALYIACSIDSFKDPRTMPKIFERLIHHKIFMTEVLDYLYGGYANSSEMTLNEDTVRKNIIQARMIELIKLNHAFPLKIQPSFLKLLADKKAYTISKDYLLTARSQLEPIQHKYAHYMAVLLCCAIEDEGSIFANAPPDVLILILNAITHLQFRSTIRIYPSDAFFKVKQKLSDEISIKHSVDTCSFGKRHNLF